MTKSFIDVEAIILGSGITGMTAASELLKSDVKSVIIDNYSEPGGNHISREFGPFTFDIGTIFFWTDSPLLTLFPGIEKEWASINFSVLRITPDRGIKRYPFDVKNELIAKPLSYVGKAVSDIISHRVLIRKKGTAADFARYYLGETLFSDSGLAYYLKRFYGFSMERISYNFAKRRMVWIADNAGLRRRLFRFSEGIAQKLGLIPKAPVLRGFARPKGGFPVMYRYALGTLTQKGVQAVLGAGIKEVERTSEGFIVRTEKGDFRAKRLINTLPLVHAAALLKLDVADPPESSSLVSLCYRFKGNRNFNSLVLYNFHAEGLWKRLTMHSDYYGEADGWQYFSVEVTVKGEVPTVQSLAEDFHKTTQVAGLFDGELDLVGHFTTDFAYPVYDEQGEARKARYINALKAVGVESIGRQGDFDYIPSATEAVNLARTYMKGTVKKQPDSPLKPLKAPEPAKPSAARSPSFGT